MRSAWYKHLTDLLQTGREGLTIALACGVGLLVGVAAIAFHELLHLVQRIALGGDSPLSILPTLPWYWKIVLPALGGALVAPIVYKWAVEAKGHGVPEVMEAVALHGGIMRARVAFAKALASAVTIGTGGSTGREGPVIQIGSALGSTCGQLLGLTPERIRTLVGCGAAGGIAATFNAPIAGAFFALEVILGNFSIPTFAPIVLSSVLATAVARSYLGDSPAFVVPEYTLVHYGEVPLYAALGMLMGLVAVVFIWALYKSEDLFERSPLPPFSRTIVGGLCVGGLLLIAPEVYGTGFEAMSRLLHETTAWQMLVFLFLLKLLATCTTLGSGASGGIFSPSLFLGVVAGGLFGQLVHFVFPSITASPAAYAMIGMGAVVAGTTHAPVTAILMLFELTDGYQIILPVMIACTLSTVTARYLHPHSIYTLKLARRGVSLSLGREETVMRSFHVADVMHRPAPTLPDDTAFQQVVSRVLDSPDPYYYTVSPGDQLTGVISLHDIKTFLNEGGLDGLVVARDMARPVHTVAHLHEPLTECLRKFRETQLDCLPVTADATSTQVIGVVTQTDLLEVYDREVLRKEFLGTLPDPTTQDEGTLAMPSQYTVLALPVPAPFREKTLQGLDLRVRYGVTVLAIRNTTASGYEDRLPQPDQPLREDETLILAGPREGMTRLQQEARVAPLSRE
ncbi:MAG: chloride channel protein [Desulfurellaceae bacterium]|nr:chloride channel protein [Desulfurellaceae bacterium]